MAAESWAPFGGLADPKSRKWGDHSRPKHSWLDNIATMSGTYSKLAALTPPRPGRSESPR